MYEQIAQAYGEPLQRTLQNQFKLATEAQPVAMFLQGLRQSKAMKMQEEEAERRAELDEWNRVKFEEQTKYNMGRDEMNDRRARDLAVIASEDRQERNQAQADNLKVAQQGNFLKWYSENVGTDTSPESVRMAAEMFGVKNVDALGKETDVEDRTDPNLMGPSPSKKVTMFPEGATWMAKMTQAKDLREGKAASLEERKADSLRRDTDRDLSRAIAAALAGHTINKEPAQRGEPPITYYGRQLAAFTKLYGDPYAELPKGYEKGQGAMAAKAEAERLTAEVYGPNWKSGGTPTAKPMAAGKRVVKRQYSSDGKQTKRVYSDGTEEVVNGIER